MLLVYKTLKVTNKGCIKAKQDIKLIHFRLLGTETPVQLLNIFQILFEAQRGNSVRGEIGLDNVVLTSGPCQDDGDPVY